MKIRRPAVVAALTTTVVAGVLSLTLADANAAAAPVQIRTMGTAMFIVSATGADVIQLTPGGFGAFGVSSSQPMTYTGGPANCAQSGPNAMRCASGVTRVDIDLGPGDDQLTNLSGLPMTAHGGPGRDRITGGGAVDRLFGGPGFDELDGGPGDDHLDGGEDGGSARGGLGNDHLESNFVYGGVGNDTLKVVYHPDLFGVAEGYYGIDTLDLSEWPIAVQVNADLPNLSTAITPNDGPICERCPIYRSTEPPYFQTYGTSSFYDSIENIYGTPYDDILIGNDLRNVIRGGGGADMIVGLGGDDLLDAGPSENGVQRIWGDDGHDTCLGDLRVSSDCEVRGEG